MAVAIKCDRCGKFEEGAGIIIRGAANRIEQQKHLCKSCHEQFKEWWDEVKLEPQGGPSC